MSNKPSISIVIPAYNEERTIVSCIEDAQKGAQQINREVQILVADNNSTDSTARLASEAGADVLPVEDQGYGSACFAGLSASDGDILIMGDGDGTYDFSAIKPFVEKIEEGYDLVIGNRFKGTIEQGAMPVLHRYLGTPILTLVCRILFGTRIGDINGGMRAIRKDAFSKLNLQTLGMEFASEMVIKAAIQDLKIGEVPCDLQQDKREGDPHLRTWRDGWRHLRLMLLLAPHGTFLLPGLVLMLLGILGIALQLLNDLELVTTLSIGMRHTASAMLLIVLGWNIRQMGLVAQNILQTTEDVHDHHLEHSLMLAAAMIGLSVCIFGYLLISYFTPFALLPLNTAARFDVAMIAATFFIIGFQKIFLSFFVSILHIRLRS